MYYKAVKSNLSFNDAINSFKNGNIIRLGYNVFDPKDMNIDNVKFSIDQIISSKWEVVDIDHDMMGKLYEVRDMMNDINNLRTVLHEMKEEVHRLNDTENEEKVRNDISFDTL